MAVKQPTATPAGKEKGLKASASSLIKSVFKKAPKKDQKPDIIDEPALIIPPNIDPADH